MQLQSCVYRVRFFYQLLMLLIYALLSLSAQAIGIYDVSLKQAQQVFSGITQIGDIDKEIWARPAFSNGQLVGYLFLSNEIAPIPAYSGKPVAVLIGLTLDARIVGIDILSRLFGKACCCADWVDFGCTNCWHRHPFPLIRESLLLC